MGSKVWTGAHQVAEGRPGGPAQPARTRVQAMSQPGALRQRRGLPWAGGERKRETEQQMMPVGETRKQKNQEAVLNFINKESQE